MSDEKNQEEEIDSGPKKRKRGAAKLPIDEAVLGKEEARRLDERRSYNRKCAAKARRRSKDLTASLRAQVRELSETNKELQRVNEIMGARLNLMEQQNRMLMMNQYQQQATAAVQAPQMTTQPLSALETQSIPSTAQQAFNPSLFQTASTGFSPTAAASVNQTSLLGGVDQQNQQLLESLQAHQLLFSSITGGVRGPLQPPDNMGG